LGLRKLSPPSKKTSEFSTRRSAIAVAIRRIEKDVAPFGERCVRRDDRGTLLAMAGGDDLVEEVGGLLIKGQIA
jgi:hypothetical protein